MAMDQYIAFFLFPQYKKEANVLVYNYSTRRDSCTMFLRKLDMSPTMESFNGISQNMLSFVIGKKLSSMYIY